MKKIIIVLAILLASCTNTKINNDSIVIAIYPWDKYYDKYEAKGYDVHFDNDNPIFIAPKNLYNVGDTVWFTKK